MKMIDEKDFEKLSPLLKGIKGKQLTGFIMKLFAFDRVNQLYDHSKQYSGADFAAAILDDLGVDYQIGNAGLLSQLPKEGFITISNHPYGGLDGIILVDLIAKLRPDYKLMVNKVLSLVKAMKENFISVMPVTNEKSDSGHINMNGIRETLKHIRGGHPVGFFPSGAVSDFSLTDLYVRDRKWQQSILNLIKSMKVPVVPIRFYDRNSALFYFLGLINWKVRLARLPHELFNKRDQEIRIGIGNIISVEEQQQFDLKSFGLHLRNAVYKMPLPDSFVKKSTIQLTSEITDIHCFKAK